MDNGHRVRQIEWTSWRYAPLLPIPIGADCDVHPRIFESSAGEVKSSRSTHELGARDLLSTTGYGSSTS
jgi:hypothetical protein